MQKRLFPISKLDVGCPPYHGHEDDNSHHKLQKCMNNFFFFLRFKTYYEYFLHDPSLPNISRKQVQKKDFANASFNETVEGISIVREFLTSAASTTVGKLHRCFPPHSMHQDLGPWSLQILRPLLLRLWCRPLMPTLRSPSTQTATPQQPSTSSKSLTFDQFKELLISFLCMEVVYL